MNCTLCHTPLVNKIDNEYYICSTCEAYLKDEVHYFNSEKEKNHYECHNNDVNDIGYQNFTAPVTNTVLENCTPDMLGLDYGCGKGPVITKQLVEKGYKVNLYDPYFHPDTAYLDSQYDYIFSCEVFEHFYNPLEEIKKLSSILKQRGILIIKTHLYNNQTDFKNWYYRKDLTHVFIYTFKTFEYIAEYFNYEVITLTERLVVLKKK
ncbi:class I SAM-dependent methyltransferase [Myroides marinus]|uniref:class I SAM-dependent methyltransferase n=1 Tax=Myroides marinus TaxID=703342 RepID=UPI0025780ECF|nr:class I SAM-dependent methyltransferase [Myroides marinus]MDM1355915.1 class I SAM-dependent methyltransferase [Myroides marinus]MDM1368125.1 class I SAM-dependent methyltransferase [Myroides marinus]MDM1403680.1 class I SAM-dependent methyltransferase [Myroides marinus]MDM1534393.1 class I SAM-dependent methyltransferase [Myroides marinus]MDM1541357.1 class I SAM-dependent methyltransferase [Myroides marinus]